MDETREEPALRCEELSDAAAYEQMRRQEAEAEVERLRRIVSRMMDADLLAARAAEMRGEWCPRCEAYRVRGGLCGCDEETQALEGWYQAAAWWVGREPHSEVAPAIREEADRRWLALTGEGRPHGDR